MAAGLQILKWPWLPEALVFIIASKDKMRYGISTLCHTQSRILFRDKALQLDSEPLMSEQIR